MERFLLSHPPSRQEFPEALIVFDSPPVFNVDKKYLYLKSELRWGDLIQFKRINSLKIQNMLIVEYRVNSEHRVWASAPGLSREAYAQWLYLLAEERWGVPVNLVQLTVLSRRRVHCEHLYLT
jgi:hypothetical protein